MTNGDAIVESRVGLQTDGGRVTLPSPVGLSGLVLPGRVGSGSAVGYVPKLNISRSRDRASALMGASADDVPNRMVAVIVSLSDLSWVLSAGVVYRVYVVSISACGEVRHFYCIDIGVACWKSWR